MSDEWKVPEGEPEKEQEPVETEKNVEVADSQDADKDSTPVTEENQTPVNEKEEKTRYPWEAVLGKEEQTQEAKPEPKPEPEQAEEQKNTDSSYHWVNPEYQKRQNGAEGEERASQNTYENQNYREDVGQTAGNQNTGYGSQSQQNSNTGWGQPVNGNRNTEAGGYQNGNWGCGTDQQAGQNAQNGSYQSGGSWNTQERKEQNGPVTGQRKYGNYTYYQQPQDTKQPTDHRKSGGMGKKVLVTAGLAVLFGVIAGGIIIGANFMVAGKTQTDQQKTEIQLPSTELPAQSAGADSGDTEAVSAGTTGEYTVAQVAKSCMPSVVSITNASVKNVQDFFGGVQEYPIESSGSGIIVGQSDSEILIATNNHVVADANTITVAFSDDEVYEAQIKGTDSDNDLAVIAVKIADMSEDTLNSIKVVSIGNSDELEIGEQVVAIGNALGYGQSVTSGWVSAVNREMTDEDGKTTGKLIQTDAAINPGNSGGALLNMQGELIGINSAKAAATEVEGMGYAIPVSVAQPILDELMNRETRYKVDEDHAGYIGVTCLNVDSTSAQTYGIPLGAFVDSVEEGGPAQTAGIQKGDVIVKFDGMSVSGSSDLVGKLEYYQAGETVEVVISRAQNGEYQEQTVSVTLGKRSEMKQTDPQANK